MLLLQYFIHLPPINPPITPPTRPSIPIVNITAMPHPAISAPAIGVDVTIKPAIIKKGIAEMMPNRNPTPAPPPTPPLHIIPAIKPPMITEKKGVMKRPSIIATIMPIIAGPTYFAILFCITTLILITS